jgi:hypothetical protein
MEVHDLLLMLRGILMRAARFRYDRPQCKAGAERRRPGKILNNPKVFPSRARMILINEAGSGLR